MTHGHIVFGLYVNVETASLYETLTYCDGLCTTDFKIKLQNFIYDVSKWYFNQYRQIMHSVSDFKHKANREK